LTGKSLIRVIEATKTFGALRAIDGVSIDVRQGEFLALLGPSGCGKTTLLRAIAGFENLQSGRIEIDGQDVTGEPPYRRPVNMVFQSYALFPHLNVTANVAFGLRQDGLERAEIDRRVADALALVRLDGLAQQRPDRLSGGQRQRVALARALVKRPKALLLDEPMAALDRKLREATRSELVRLQRDSGTTFIMVTHDQEEALATASRVAVMREGRLVQIGTPEDIYDRPISRWAAEFVGEINVFDAVMAEGGDLIAPSLGHRVGRAETIERGSVFGLRPERIGLLPVAGEGGVEGIVIETSFLGDRVLMRVRVKAGGVLKVSLSADAARAGKVRHGAAVRLAWSEDAVMALAE